MSQDRISLEFQEVAKIPLDGQGSRNSEGDRKTGHFGMQTFIASNFMNKIMSFFLSCRYDTACHFGMVSVF